MKYYTYRGTWLDTGYTVICNNPIGGIISEEAKWFDALADRRTSASAETPTEQDARLVREALIKQREELGSTTPSEAGFEKVMTEARKAGLFNEETNE